MHDAAREQLRRRTKRTQRTVAVGKDRMHGWQRTLAASMDAGQSWFILALIGAVIGINAAFLNVVTEWLYDVRFGHCTTALYLNEKFCCWGDDACPEWRVWSSFWPASYLGFIAIGAFFAFLSARLVQMAPYAAGSGISEIKCILAGFVMSGFLGFWTLIIKSIGLPLAIASGLTVGKEGPSVHTAVCAGNVISRMFAKYRESASKTRELFSACAAAGVAVAFGSPIGGVLFSLEEMCSNFPMRTMVRSYFCALVATAVLAAMNPFRTGQLVMFQIHYDRDWHFFEVIFYIVIGTFGGLYGAFVIRWNLRVQALRRKYLADYGVLEAVLLAALTAAVGYFNIFVRIDMTESMEILFRECEGGVDYEGLCRPERRAHMVGSLALATLLRIAFVIVSYGAKVPAGIFVPSMAIGASFGRLVGILVEALHDAFPSSAFFSACQPDVPCITPGSYALLGAGAALSGIMHITVSVVVIMFELTGALTYILPTMIVVGVTKAVGGAFGHGGIADRMIWFNGFPFIDGKEEYSFGVPVSHVMNSQVVMLPVRGMSIRELEMSLSTTNYQGFPVVQDMTEPYLLGYIERQDLIHGIERARRTHGLRKDADCFFSTPDEKASHAPEWASDHYVDFAQYIHITPLTVQPGLALETAMDVFKKLGPRVILVEHAGKLCGLVTVKDVLKYQFQVENEHPRRATAVDERALRRIWAVMQRLWSWILRRPVDEEVEEMELDGL